MKPKSAKQKGKQLEIKGFENYYINSDGYVVSKSRQKGFVFENEMILKSGIGSGGYKLVILRKDNRSFTKRIHRLVAEAFISNQENKPCVNHIDGNKLNNNVNNLEWCTYSYNNQDAYDNNLKGRGEKHYISKLKKDDIPFIRKSKLSSKALGNMFKVSPATIYDVKKIITWKHI